MSNTIERVHISVNGVTYALSPLEQVGEIKATVLSALHEGGGFVDVTANGGERISILITAPIELTISAASFTLDSDDADKANDTLGPESGIIYGHDDGSGYDTF